MLNLPKATELHKQLPKSQIYKKFQLTNAQQTAFDDDISRIDIVNEISTRTIPGMKEGENIKSFYVLNVSLKTKDYDPKNIERIAKLIPQNLIFVLQYEEEIQLAVHFETVFLHTPWTSLVDKSITLLGLDIESVWNNLISEISGLSERKQNTEELKSSIELQTRLHELERKLIVAEKKARTEVQPRQKFELVQNVKKIKEEIDTIIKELENI